jgi:hypothetical protein
MLIQNINSVLKHLLIHKYLKIHFILEIFLIDNVIMDIYSDGLLYL